MNDNDPRSMEIGMNECMRPKVVLSSTRQLGVKKVPTKLQTFLIQFQALVELVRKVC